MIKQKITTLLILIICSNFCFAQDYYAYYEGIKKAKLSLIEDSLEVSINHYHQTFEKFDFVFARDCFNALEVSTKVGNQKMTDYFLRRSLKQGIEFNLLNQDSILTAFKKTEFWPNILSVKDSLKEIYTNNVNWEIRNEIISMFGEDQTIRDLADKNRFNIFRIRKLNKQFEEIDAKLVLRLIEITKKYGFPGEKLIGLDVESMHPKINTHDLSAGMPIVILIHHFSQPNKSYNSILIDEIQTGNLSNEHYATISDFQHTYGEELNGITPCYSKRFTSEESTEKINANRREIGLISISNTYTVKRKEYITPFWLRLK